LQEMIKDMDNKILKKVGFGVLMFLCLTPLVSSPIALVMGFLFTCFLGNPFAKYNHQATNWLLKVSVIGLGFGMNMGHAVDAGKQGFELTIFTIGSIILLGVILGRVLKINSKTRHLLSSGTAICGGSAIAAVAPVVNASEKDMSVALGVIFGLNAIALILFPLIGHTLHLSQYEFGLWSALAIQDTSSVIGAASAYGKEALQIATTVKLARALWIVPVALISAFVFKSKSKKIKIPWFIGLFILAMLLNTYVNLPDLFTSSIVYASRALLVLTLFLVGAGMSIAQIKAVGWKPLILGISLWVFVSVISLLIILHIA